MEQLKSHPFFEGIDWEHLSEQKPPELLPYLPATKDNPDELWSRVSMSILSSMLF